VTDSTFHLTDNDQITTIIAGCRENNRGSQKLLYYLLQDYAIKICYRYTNHAEEVQELVNEGFLKLFKNIHQFDETRYPDILLSLKGWFKRIVINTCIDQYRKNSAMMKGHQLTSENENLPDTAATGVDKLSYKELIEAIRLLSPTYRTVFNLFVLEGFSHEEISKQLGISVGASKSNLSKARENLRKIILKKTQYRAYA
jgi:RNA polymerase sigma factor (sigma-70 family)